MDSTFKERLKYFETTLSTDIPNDEADPEWKPVIDMKSFREACFYGIPDESGLRATAWKVLIGYLPPDKRMWSKVLATQRMCYYNWVRDLLEDPDGEPPSTDHPLNVEPGSKWAIYFHDNNILEQIDKDVRRTLPDIAFFQTHVPRNPLNPLSPPNTSQKEDEASDPLTATEDNEKPAGRRFSFGFMGRPRSSSTASKKSLRTATVANGSSNNNRSRSNSRSSVHSSQSGVVAADTSTSPRNIVRKFSSAFKSSSSNLTASVIPQPKRKYDLKNLKPLCPYIPNRRAIFARIAHMNNDFGIQADQGDQSNERLLDPNAQDLHWEAVERILFVYAKLNPGVGYVQGMNELLAPIYYVFAKDSHPESQAHAEADAFFVFTILMSDVRDHFVRSMDQDASTGINATMQRMSQRLSWVDKPLWRDLKRKDIKEQYYAFRWITVLCSQEWDLPDVIRLWDSILADRGTQEDSNDMRFEFLLDFTVAMVICVRQEILKDDFAGNVRLLQNYPIDDIQVVLTAAYSIRDRRLKALAAGQIVPGVNDQRCSGFFSSDWSDTSSVASSGSGSRLQRLRDTTDMARQSFDSFRRESKESLDEFFRRASTREVTDAWKRASTGEMARSLSQRLASVNGLATKMRRASSAYQNGTDTLADGLHRSSSVSSTRSDRVPPRTHSLINRFSQMMSTNNNTSVSPYSRLKAFSTSRQTTQQLPTFASGKEEAINTTKTSQTYYQGYV